MCVVTVEKCYRCGQPCNPVQFHRSQEKGKEGKDLPVCKKCADKFAEGGRMPK